MPVSMSDPEVACVDRIISSMVPSRVTEFNELIERYFTCESFRAATNAGLIKFVGQTGGCDRIKAVEVLGVLRVKAAEDLLAEMLASRDPSRTVGVDCNESGTSEDQFLVVRLYTSLLLINRERWEEPTRAAATRFGNSWMRQALLGTLAAAPKQ
jgi:hypothetical protein